jgi:PPOX class probable F420-dependent enzyme
MMTTNEQHQAALEPFAALRGSSVVLLTSFRRDGQGIGTPVGFNLANGKGYFTTWTTTGKVKRIANNPRVILAPCTRTGKVIGSTVAGIARRLDSVETARVLDMLRPGLWGWLWNVIYKLQRRQPVLYEVSPADDLQSRGA